jgi:ABC-type uncharacterized transport system substrate-binding protein
MAASLRIARSAAAAALLALASGAPDAARAHPHVFIDSGVDFLFDPEGRLAQVRVTWLYDHLSTLLLLEDLGIAPDADGAIAEADKAAIARDQSQWVEGYEGDATLRHAGARIGLSRPIEPQADYRDGQVEIRFLRALETPIHPDDTTVVKLYDPTYFVAYYASFEPGLEHAPDAAGRRSSRSSRPARSSPSSRASSPCRPRRIPTSLSATSSPTRSA